MSTIDKKMLGITEVVTPENLDERVISRYVTQVSLGSKLKEAVGGAESEPNPVIVPNPVKTDTEVPTVTEPNPVKTDTEVPTVTEPNPVKTDTEVPTEDKTEPEPEIIEIPKTSEDEEIAVDEEAV